MSDIRLNLDRLQAVHDRLDGLVTEFDATERFNHAVADATGHAVLAGAVGTFANWWNVRRDDLTEELRFLADATRAMHDTFVELDEYLAKKAAEITVDED